MKIGDKVPVVLQIIGEAVHGESIVDNDGNVFEISNLRRNKFWAAPIGQKWPRYLVCDDGDTQAGMIKRRAIVDLIECGVGA